MSRTFCGQVTSALKTVEHLLLSYICMILSADVCKSELCCELLDVFPASYWPGRRRAAQTSRSCGMFLYLLQYEHSLRQYCTFLASVAGVGTSLCSSQKKSSVTDECRQLLTV